MYNVPSIILDGIVIDYSTSYFTHATLAHKIMLQINRNDNCTPHALTTCNDHFVYSS